MSRIKLAGLIALGTLAAYRAVSAYKQASVFCETYSGVLESCALSEKEDYVYRSYSHGHSRHQCRDGNYVKVTSYTATYTFADGTIITLAGRPTIIYPKGTTLALLTNGLRERRIVASTNDPE